MARQPEHVVVHRDLDRSPRDAHPLARPDQPGARTPARRRGGPVVLHHQVHGAGRPVRAADVHGDRAPGGPGVLHDVRRRLPQDPRHDVVGSPEPLVPRPAVEVGVHLAPHAGVGEQPHRGRQFRLQREHPVPGHQRAQVRGGGVAQAQHVVQLARQRLTAPTALVRRASSTLREIAARLRPSRSCRSRDTRTLSASTSAWASSARASSSSRYVPTQRRTTNSRTDVASS